MAQKQYTLKTYSLSGAYISTISPRLIMSEPSYSATTEGGQWELALKLAVAGDSALLTYGTIVKLVEVDSANPLGRQIYAGYVTQIKRIFQETEYIEIRVVGLASLLSFLIYPNGTYTGTPWNLAKAVIDYFSTVYPGLLSYTASSVDTTGSSVSVALTQYATCFDALKTIIATTKNFWSVDALGIFNFRPAGSYGSHILTLGREVESLEIEENSEQIANAITVFGSFGTWTATDSASILANGRREKAFNVPEISAVPTATTRAQAELEKYKSPKKRISATVNSTYDLESLQCGDRVTIRNSKVAIDSLQIRRISYTEQEVKLDLEETRSFAQSVSDIS